MDRGLAEAGEQQRVCGGLRAFVAEIALTRVQVTGQHRDRVIPAAAPGDPELKLSDPEPHPQGEGGWPRDNAV
jgi:hypothetical protein